MAFVNPYHQPSTDTPNDAPGHSDAENGKEGSASNLQQHHAKGSCSENDLRATDGALATVSSTEGTADASVESLGSIGHPNTCAEPCKYFWKARGCKDGAKCTRCHRCPWINPPGACRTHRSGRAVKRARKKDDDDPDSDKDGLERISKRARTLAVPNVGQPLPPPAAWDPWRYPAPYGRHIPGAPLPLPPGYVSAPPPGYPPAGYGYPPAASPGIAAGYPSPGSYPSASGCAPPHLSAGYGPPPYGYAPPPADYRYLQLSGAQGPPANVGPYHLSSAHGPRNAPPLGGLPHGPPLAGPPGYSPPPPAHGSHQPIYGQPLPAYRLPPGYGPPPGYTPQAGAVLA